MNFLVTGAIKDVEGCIKIIEGFNHKIVFMQQERDSLPCLPEWVEGIVGNGIFLYHEISQFKNLKYIQLTSVGFDRVPMDYIKSHGITIFNAKGVYSIPMAEFALAEVLSVYKKIQIFDENQKGHRWEKQRCLLELYGKSICIIGCGSVGTECAKRFSAFGCEVYGVDLFPYKSEWYNEIESLTVLDNFLPKMDVVILTLPLSKETEGLINGQRLEKMKEGAVLLNISRGKIIDEKALVKNGKHLGAIILDVFEEEPLHENNSLWEAKNVIITPHNSFVGENNSARLNQIIFENLKGVEL